MIARSILRTNEEQISLTLERAQEILTTVVPCLERAQALKLISSQSKLPEAWKVLDGNIGYLHAGSVQKGFEKALARDLVGKSGLVVDLRCYPSQPIVRTVAMQLVPRRTVFYRVTGAVSGEPGAFAFIPHGYVGSFKILYFPGKVAILVDERTQSSAEYAAMGLRVAPKANVFGSMTAGADGNVSRFTLPGNLRTQVSGIGVYTPERKDTQRVGIIPDVRVEPTIAGVRAGRDKVLEFALEWIRSEEK